MKKYYIIALLLCLSLNSFSQASSDKLIRKGVGMHERGKYKEAIRYYEEALKLNSTSMSAIYEMSLSYLYLKDYDNALKYSTKVINANYQLLIIDAYCVKSTALSELGQEDQAIKLLNEAISKYKDEYLLHYNLGYSYFKQGNYELAINNLRKAIEIDPTHPDTFLLYAYSLNDTNKWVESFLSFHFFLLLEPNTERSKDAFGEMYDLINQTIDENSPGLEMEEGIDRQKLYAYIQRIKPVDDDPESKYRFFEQVSKSIFFTLGQIQNDTQSGPIWDFFVPIYSEILNSGYFETYCRYISACHSPQSLTWWNNNHKKVDNFIAWFEDGQGAEDEEADFGDDSDLDDNTEAVDED
ncbi:tetratricopeptide repeat protein [Dysgonomonas sp. 520]|uniref:tetratricopeptide repeat protein n=1 Tax=Dysgonomonas sp. 520 TaxID=2302931 RepID=UPI0013D4F216|nr:tetratricopeptide repeat protein [Dysgonomonas sp. 520]NDW09170.1 tetratricopeptide repeat protein [Dysgonomonas sp. 520]